MAHKDAVGRGSRVAVQKWLRDGMEQTGVPVWCDTLAAGGLILHTENMLGWQHFGS